MVEGVAQDLRDPLHLTPVLVPKPWGGRRLERYGRRLPPKVPIGESWDVADLDPATTNIEDPATRVAEGPLKGQRLSDLIARDRDALLGDAPDLDGRFPLLVKLLDAQQHLSVQVHPPIGDMADQLGAQPKVESWVVLEADPGSQLMIGVAPGVTPSILADTVGTPGMVPLLRRIAAVPGEVHHIPAGTLHCLGAGVLIAEVQTPSDSTFRVYDWAEKYHRNPRKLHLDEAMRSIVHSWDQNVAPTRWPAVGRRRAADESPNSTVLAQTPYYEVARYRLGAGEERKVEPGIMRVVQVIEGSVHGDGFAWLVAAGGTVVLPAAWKGVLRSSRSTVWLESTVPGSIAP